MTSNHPVKLGGLGEVASINPLIDMGEPKERIQHLIEEHKNRLTRIRQRREDLIRKMRELVAQEQSLKSADEKVYAELQTLRESFRRLEDMER